MARDGYFATWLWAGGAAIAGLLLTAAAVLGTRHVETLEARHAFRQAADARVDHLAARLHRATAAVKVLRDYFHASRDVTRAEFRAFARPVLDEHPGILALEWAPKVAHGSRGALEARMRRRGHPDFRVVERDAAGNPGPAGARDTYFPVLFIAPAAGNEAALGFDLASGATRRAALREARDRGRMRLSGRISLIQSDDEHYGFLAFAPVYEGHSVPKNRAARRDGLAGFALGAFRMDHLVTGTHHHASDRAEAGTTLRIADVTNPDAPRRLYPHAADAASTAAGGRRYRRTLGAGGRQWRVTVAPTASFQEGRPPRLAWAVLGAGLVLTALLATMAGVFARKERARRAAAAALEQRTQELGERVKELGGLYALAETLDRPDVSPETALTEAVNLLPPAWQYPAVTVARLAIGDWVAATPGFRETPWCQAGDIVVNGTVEGRIQVCYLAERPPRDEGPFLAEERQLLHTIAARLGDYIARTRAMAEWRKALELLRNAEQVARACAWEWDLASDVFRLSDNRRAVLGITGARQPAEAMLALIHPDDRPRLAEAMDAARDGRPPQHERFRIHHGDTGEVRHVDAYTTVAADEGGTPQAVLGATQDVTEQVRAERALMERSERLRQANAELRESERNYRLLVNQHPDFLVLRYRPDTTVLFANPAYAALFGATPEGITGRRWLDFGVPEAAHDAVLAHLQGFTPDQPSAVHENQVVDGDGRPRWTRWSNHAFFDDTGAITHFQSVGLDITDRKEMEQALRQREEHLRLILESSGEGIYEVDRDGTCRLANKAAATMLGHDSAEAITGRNAHALFHHAHADGTPYPAADCPMTACLAGGQPVSVDDEVFWRADGTAFPVSYRAYPLRRDGRVEGAVVYFTDMTEALERRRREQITQRMESLGNLAGGVAHDLNNMLQPILSLTTLVARDQPEGSRDRERLDKVVEAAERARSLVGDILAFSRQTEEALERIDLPATVEKVMGLLHETIPSTLTINESIDPATGTVLADPAQIQTILMNIAVNAAQAQGHRPGTLTITLAPETMDAATAADLGDMEPGAYARLSVADTAGGMDQAVLTRIFDPFFTTKPVGEGTGLGLSVVYGTARKLGGTVTVRTTLGQGTAFHVYLPLADEG